ncbi:hypothetical protein KCP74_13235 [Salmonella enterica subsp. enterica]|nr:hypothetical protein KCP74_13235 [Salmonella enterica subsp. enterica]
MGLIIRYSSDTLARSGHRTVNQACRSPPSALGLLLALIIGLAGGVSLGQSVDNDNKYRWRRLSAPACCFRVLRR